MAVWSEVWLKGLHGAFRLDADCYQPLFLKDTYAIHRFKTARLGEIATITDGQHGYHIVDPSSGIFHITAKCVRQGMVFADGADCLSKVTHENNRRSQLQADDILLTTAGTLGVAGIVTGDILPANIDQDVARITIGRNSPVDPWFVVPFLLSEMGQFQLQRATTGQIQFHIALSAIREIEIPIIPTQRKVAGLLKESVQSLLNSRSLYIQAEELLSNSLGLKNLDLCPSLFYERPYREVAAARRADADFYMPRHYRLLEAIRKTGAARRLGDVVEHCERGLQPEYDDGGEILVVNTKHLGPQFLAGDYEHCATDAWARQKKARLQQHDVLLYSTGAYIGRTNCWFEMTKAIGSNHVTIIRPKSECNPIYLSLFLNSTAGPMQTDRHAHGSAQREIYPSDIRDFTIWLPPMKKQEQLAELVLKAKAARDESHRMLEEAKRAVESKILQLSP